MEHDDLLVNTIGNYDGRVSTIFGNDKDKYLEISSEGSWRVTFSPIIAMPELANNQVMTGDDVIALKSNALKLNIKNTGESNFVVRGITSDYKVDLLVNEIGNYEGTVPNRDYKILVVESKGTWQISW
jgi:hypothetical protein